MNDQDTGLRLMMILGDADAQAVYDAAIVARYAAEGASGASGVRAIFSLRLRLPGFITSRVRGQTT